MAKAPAAAKPVAPAPVVLDADEEDEAPTPPPAPAKGAAPAKAAPATPAPKPAAAAPAAAAKPAAPAAAPAAEEVGDEEESAADASGTESSGIECVPAISEIEVRRPLPLSCTTTKPGIDQVELRYKAPGRKKWTKLLLRKSGDDFNGDIPCMALTKHGVLRLSIVGMDADDKPLARISGVNIQVVEASNQPPPALPGREPPMRCYEEKDCPPELKGSPACPGTKATPGARSWGASCEKTSQCQTGLACISGSCEKPNKCDSTSECGTGECVSGVCQYPDPDEVASRLGPGKLNWIGLHFGYDFAIGGSGNGICGNATSDGKDKYDCYQGGELYTRTPNVYGAGVANGGFLPSTFRIMASYDRWFNRLGAGARVGWAFAGAPKDFKPLHIELRVLYSMRAEPLSKRFRPYVGLAGGMARVDAHSKASVIDCNAMTADCINADPMTLAGKARVLKLDAYRIGSSAFFGPTVGAIWALANDSAIQVNVNVMLPDGVIEPSVGYLMGL
ncbi:MAG: hypothetical protein QM756_11370 [Polyangiaceae bacterium]